MLCALGWLIAGVALFVLAYEHADDTDSPAGRAAAQWMFIITMMMLLAAVAMVYPFASAWDAVRRGLGNKSRGR